MIREHIQSIPLGYSEAEFKGKKYGVTRTDFNKGRSIKIYARELGGKDVVSLNYYMTGKKDSLKPCEMPAEKVIEFLTQHKTIDYGVRKFRKYAL